MQDVALKPLAVPAPAELAAMTFPSYRPLLDLEPRPRHPELGEKHPIQPFAIVAWRGKTPAGLALAETPVAGNDARPPQLLSVFVDPGARRKGLGEALVGAVEEETRRRGFGDLEAVYTSGKTAIAWIERIFARRGWEPPEPRSLMMRFTPRDSLASPAFENRRRLAAFGRGIEIFPWSQLTREDEEEMRRSNRLHRWIEPALEPWQFDPRELHASSVGARYRKQVVGWVLNHCVVPGNVRFSISYMRPDLARRGRVFPLYHASLQRLVDQGSCRSCTFTTPFSYPRMVAFARSCIAPISTFVGESRAVRILLTSPALAVAS